MDEEDEARLRLRQWAHWILSGQKNPFLDPLAHEKQPLLKRGRVKAVIEFTALDIRMIRDQFHMTQRQFAKIIGVSRHTLRNWEKGRRRPLGPSRALLRAIAADPVHVGKALNWNRFDRKLEPLEWDDNW